jgi:hypothetical protein
MASNNQPISRRSSEICATVERKCETVVAKFHRDRAPPKAGLVG